MLEFFELLLSDYTFRIIALGTAALGAISGMLGSFAVLRKQSLLGDAISHAALPGIVMAFILFQAKDSYVLLAGALCSGVLGSLLVNGIVRKSKIKTDAALGIVLSVFFGFGMLLLTYVQKKPDAAQAGLDKYLFGQAATLMLNDVKLLIVVLGIALAILFIFWKELKVMIFDEDYALTLGINTRFLDVLITIFIVLAIVLGLQTVGVVLMSAMLLAPAAAARQWTNNLGKMLIIASVIGACSGVVGTAISATQPNLSTGPVIVIVAITFVLFSFLLAPTRGIISRQLKIQKNKKELLLKKSIAVVYSFMVNNEELVEGVEKNKLLKLRDIDEQVIKLLYEKKWIKYIDSQIVALTEEGRDIAEKIELI